MSDDGSGIPSAADDRATSLGEVLNLAVQVGLRGLYTSIPAKVVKYDASTNKANCQILVKDVTQAEDGSRAVNSMPVVTGVPVQFFGDGTFRVTCVISDGSGSAPATMGMLIFCHRSIDAWTTGTGAEVDPGYDHDHGLVDAVFMPGLMPFGAPYQDVPTDGMSIGVDGGLHVKVAQDVVTVAKIDGQANLVAIANKVNTIANALWTIINGVCGATASPIPEPGNGANSALQAAFKVAIATQTGQDNLPPADVSAQYLQAQ